MGIPKSEKPLLIAPNCTWFRMKSHVQLHLVFILKRFLLKGPVEIIELKGDKTSVQTELQFRKKLFRETLHGKRLIMGDLKDIKKKLLAKGKGIVKSSSTWKFKFRALYFYKLPVSFDPMFQSLLPLKRQKWTKNPKLPLATESSHSHRPKEWMTNNWDSLLANSMLLLIRFI